MLFTFGHCQNVSPIPCRDLVSCSLFAHSGWCLASFLAQDHLPRMVPPIVGLPTSINNQCSFPSDMIPGYSDLGNSSVNSRLCQVESCSSLGNPACQLGRRKIVFSNNKGMGLVTQLIHLMLRNREEAVVSGQLLLVTFVQL